MSIARDKELLSALFDGVSISVLADLFGKDKREVSKLIRNVTPTGKRGGFDIFSIRDAAKYLVEPNIDLGEYIKNLRPNDLPPMLQKDYWAAQRSRQIYEAEAGDLWPTDEVREVFAEVFKKLRTGILLFTDTIEAKTELTDKQRTLITSMSDALLDELHKSLIEGDPDVDTRTDEEIFGAD